MLVKLRDGPKSPYLGVNLVESVSCQLGGSVCGAVLRVDKKVYKCTLLQSIAMVASKKHCQEQLDGNGHGHSLLSFMKLASTKVKTALEKPNSFKRNINHRRFLQKQFKALVKSPEKAPASRKQCNLAKENMMQQLDYRPARCNNHRMPPSPVDMTSLPFAPLQPFIPAMDLQQTTANAFTANPSLNNACERSCCDYENTNRVRHETNYYSSLPELVAEDDGFLTGEELTHAIELKDLFIPETDLLQCLSIRDMSLDILGGDIETNSDFDSWICREFLVNNERTVY